MKRTTKTQILIILLIAVAAIVLLLIPKQSGFYAEVSYNGDVIMQIPLDVDKTYNIDADLPVTLKVENGTICFENSQCPDHICEGFGRIGKDGEYAICLPASVAVQIKAK